MSFFFDVASETRRGGAHSLCEQLVLCGPVAEPPPKAIVRPCESVERRSAHVTPTHTTVPAALHPGPSFDK